MTQGFTTASPAITTSKQLPEAAFFTSLYEVDSAIKKLEAEVELAQVKLELTQTEIRLATEDEAVFAKEADEAYCQLRALEKAFAMKVRRDPHVVGKLHLRLTFPEEPTVPALKVVLDVNGEELKVDVCEPPVFLLDTLLRETNLNNCEGARAAFIATLRDKHKLYRSSQCACFVPEIIA
jgi:hypothetical protein